MSEVTPKTRGKRVKVEVSAETIEHAVRADSSHCMVADALKDQVPGITNVSVDLQTIRFSDRKKGVRYVYLTPPDAQVALVKFDQGIDPEPFAFNLNSPSVHVIRASSKADPNKKRRPVNAGPTSLATTANGQPVVRGGKQPPVAVLADDPRRGRVRRFGMRNLNNRV